jgi:hypothetical protein
MLLLTIQQGACLGLAGSFCNTLQNPVHTVVNYDRLYFLDEQHTDNHTRPPTGAPKCAEFFIDRD